MVDPYSGSTSVQSNHKLTSMRHCEKYKWENNGMVVIVNYN